MGITMREIAIRLLDEEENAPLRALLDAYELRRRLNNSTKVYIKHNKLNNGTKPQYKNNGTKGKSRSKRG